MLSTILVLALAATRVIATPMPVASAVPDPTEVTINEISYGGTGCPQGSLSSFIAADRQTFTLIFDNYVASIGPGVAVTENRKNCQLNLDLEYPSGFQYSILSTEYRGYVGIDAKVSGSQGSTFYFSGETAQVSTSTAFIGPLSEEYEVTDTLPLTSTIWSPCGAALPLNIDSEVVLTTNSATATGQITDDSIDGGIVFQVGIQWQTC